MALRAIRGAIQLAADDPQQMGDGVVELLTTIIERNHLSTDDLVSVVFTATPDLRSEFPAVAARRLGLGDVPLLCAQEIDVADALPRVIRVMAYAETPLTRGEVSHVYLGGAQVLRRDIAQ